MMKSIKTSVVAVLCLLLTGFAANAQQKISGTVIDSYGEAVIGAGVFQKDTNNGTVTDVDGKFSLTVPGGQQLLSPASGTRTMSSASTPRAFTPSPSRKTQKHWKQSRS